MKIEKGPFAGTEIPENEITYLLSNNGEDLPFWPTHARTPIFLDKYRPENGWQVVIENHAGPFNLPDTRKSDAFTSEILVQPTQLFVAKLIKEGTTYAQASMLAIIDGPSAWEKGETTARGRLYESQGLYGFLPRNPSGVSTGTRGNSQSVPEVVPAAASSIPLHVAPVTTIAPSRSAKDEANGAAEAPANAPSQEPTSEATVQPSEAAVQVESQPSPVEALPKTDAVVLQGPSPRSDRGSHSNIGRGVNDNLREQIVFLAESQGRQIPEIKDNKEAKAFYKELLKASAPAAENAS